MAIFGNNRCVALEASDIEADMSYGGISGCARALHEAKENDQALFVSVITNDIQSVLSEEWEQREAINEATVKGIWDSIVKIFEKLVAKIKGIIATATAKMTAFFTDGDKLYKQYAKVLNGKDLSGCKVKARVFDVNKYFSMSGVTPAQWTLDIIGNCDGKEADAVAAEMVSKCFPSAYISAKEGKSADEAFDTCFAAEAEITATVDGWVKESLSKSLLASFIKYNKTTEAAANNLVKSAKKKASEIEKSVTKATSKNMSDQAKEAGDKAEAAAGCAVAAASKFQSEVITFTTARINAAKKAAIQGRKVFMAAVSYKAKGSDKKEAKETAKNEGFEFVEEAIDFANLYSVIGEESYIEAANLVEFEAESALA